MNGFEQFINAIFGGQISADKIVSIAVGIYAVVKSITEWISKKKLIKMENEQSSLLSELKAAREDNKTLKQCVSKLGDVVLTAYLSSNTVPAEVKKELSIIGGELNKVADIPLSDTTTKLIEVVKTVAPESDLLGHQEEIEEASKLAEEVIDSANELAQEAIDKISI